MPRRVGRPKRETKPVIHQVKLLLYKGEDDDLIAFFNGLPDGAKASAVKTAMRSGNLGNVTDNTIDDDEILDSLSGLLL